MPFTGVSHASLDFILQMGAARAPQRACLLCWPQYQDHHLGAASSSRVRLGPVRPEALELAPRVPHQLLHHWLPWPSLYFPPLSSFLSFFFPPPTVIPFYILCSLFLLSLLPTCVVLAMGFLKWYSEPPWILGSGGRRVGEASGALGVSLASVISPTEISYRARISVSFCRGSKVQGHLSWVPWLPFLLTYFNSALIS